MSSLLIRGGEVVTAEGQRVADIHVDVGVVRAVGPDLDVAADRVIDAGGLMVFPGGVDVHTHLDMPYCGTRTSDDFDTGHRAAAAGGTTMHIDFATPERGGSLLEAFDVWQSRAHGKASIDYAFHMAVLHWDDEVAREMGEVVARGVTSFKCFLAYKGRLDVTDAELFNVFRRARELGALVLVHCENADIIALNQAELLAEGKTAPRYHAVSRGPAVEAEGTARAVAIAGMAGCPLYVVHLTCGESLTHVQRARAEGQHVFAETCSQYLTLDSESCYASDDFDVARFVLSPPLRPRHNQPLLWKALADDDLQVVSTDHAPTFLATDKALGKDDFTMIPNGLPMIEERLKLLLTHGVAEGRLSPERFVQVTSTRPAKLFGLWPLKGALELGSHADLFLWDPTAVTTIRADDQQMNTDYSCFEGWEVRGRVVTTIRRGEVIWDGEAFLGVPGSGQYVAREPFSPAVYR